MIEITTPLNRKQILDLKVGDQVSLTGVIYTSRDQAHRRLCQLLAKGKKLPFDLKGQVIYYCGPTKTPPGRIIGSCGPTTSRRMDEFTLPLLKGGLAAMIGKGDRCREVLQAIKKYRGIYFITYAGCGALLSKYVSGAKVVGLAELGPEAIQRLEVKNFPLIVAIDCKGENIFRGREK